MEMAYALWAVCRDTKVKMLYGDAEKYVAKQRKIWVKYVLNKIFFGKENLIFSLKSI